MLILMQVDPIQALPMPDENLIYIPPGSCHAADNYFPNIVEDLGLFIMQIKSNVTGMEMTSFVQNILVLYFE